MTFVIITHVSHTKWRNQYFAYEPYVREMNVWLKYVDEVIVVAPKSLIPTTAIDAEYLHKNIKYTEIPFIQFTTFKDCFFSAIKIPLIIWAIFKSCKSADHIHLRCPGNIGLLGCLVQIFFPSKTKTAKYAGNWDPNAKQPLSYKFQKWLLSNTFLTKNIKVLVYGDWKNQTKNVKSFFTASFLNNEKESLILRDYTQNLNFVFLGTLVEGKQPMLAVKIIEALHKQGRRVCLNIYGDGVLKDQLQQYIKNNNLDSLITLHGNKSKEVVKAALKSAHFLILLSKSEGWPKAIAEAMFFGAIPIATPVSCVSKMLDFGNRGLLVEGDLIKDELKIIELLNDVEKLESMSKMALNWSQNYTLEVFEEEISKLLN